MDFSGFTRIVEEGRYNVTFCGACNCMTKTINGKCGKCGVLKWEEENDTSNEKARHDNSKC